MVHLYCGEGKGKTTAAMGLALRMAGRGKRVVVAQFLKGADSGERLALAQVPGVRLLEVPERVKFSFQLTPAEREALPQNSPPIISTRTERPLPDRQPACSASGSAESKASLSSRRSSTGTGESTKSVMLPLGSSFTTLTFIISTPLLKKIISSMNHGKTIITYYSDNLEKFFYDFRKKEISYNEPQKFTRTAHLYGTIKITTQ